jgi:SAM-dependent methyltransferase
VSDRKGYFACEAAGGVRAYNCAGEYEVVLSLLAGEARGMLLDVGCGSGAFLRLAARHQGWRTLGLDADPGLCECPEVEVRKADFAIALPLPDAAADHVVCLQTVEHVENPFHLVRELARVARPGALVVVTTPNVLEYLTRLPFLLTGFHEACPRPHRAHDAPRTWHHINLIEYPRLAYAFEVAGLTIDRVTTNRYRKSALLAGLPLFALTWMALRRALAAEDDVLQRRKNREHASHLLSPVVLLGRTLILAGRKPACPEVGS